MNSESPDELTSILRELGSFADQARHTRQQTERAKVLLRRFKELVPSRAARHRMLPSMNPGTMDHYSGPKKSKAEPSLGPRDDSSSYDYDNPNDYGPLFHRMIKSGLDAKKVARAVELEERLRASGIDILEFAEHAETLRNHAKNSDSMRMMAELINGDFSLDDMVTTYDHIKRLENMSITTEQIGQIVKHLEKVGAKDLMATGDLANYRREQEESVKIAESKKRTANEQLDETNKRLQEAAKKEQSM